MNNTRNSKYNPEGYEDTTPMLAIRNVGVEFKAYKLFETMWHVAKLAGFDVVGTIIVKDRNGISYDGLELKHKGLNKAKKVQQDKQSENV